MREVREKLGAASYGTLYVVDAADGLHGTITLHDLADSAFDTEIDLLLNAQDVARLHPPVLEVGEDLGAAMQRMQTEEDDHIAVVQDQTSMRLMGVVHQRDVMMAYRRAILASRADEEDRE